MAVPRYDKSCHGGRGDRAPESAWPVVKGPLDIVLFEGWMLGFTPVPKEAAEKVPPLITTPLLGAVPACARPGLSVNSTCMRL